MCKLRVMRGAFLLGIFFLLLGCRHASADVSKNECEGFKQSFFLLPAASQPDALKNLNIDDQYVVYICAVQYREPPLIHLATPIAEQGKKVLPLLAAKLELAQKDVTIKDILRIFEEMASLNLYSFRENKALMVTIDDAIGRVKDPFWKASCLESLARIR